MYWRAIIRFSLNRDTNSVLRNAIAEELTKKGFVRTKTATWELESEKRQDVLRAVREITRLVENPANLPKVNKRVILDHLWVYIDQPLRKAPRVSAP